MPYSNSTFVFIIRVWYEPREIEDTKPEWRGMVENIKTHEIAYFDHPELLIDYIKQKTEFTNTKKKN